MGPIRSPKRIMGEGGLPAGGRQPEAPGPLPPHAQDSTER
jgi:hypothetical protein